MISNKKVWFGRPQMEIPCVLCVMLWTILLCLRADDTIFINYHIGIHYSFHDIILVLFS